MANDWGGGHEEYTGKHRKKEGCFITLVVPAVALLLMWWSL